eukprot:290837-Rhodomonas_salina.1
MKRHLQCAVRVVPPQTNKPRDGSHEQRGGDECLPGHEAARERLRYEKHARRSQWTVQQPGDIVHTPVG